MTKDVRETIERTVQGGRRWTLPQRAGAGIAGLAITLAASSGSAGEGGVNASNGDTDFSVNFRFPPTAQQIADVKSAIDLMAFGVCDVTDGNLRIRRVKLLQGQATEDLGDYWLQASNFRSGVSFFTNGANLGTLGAHIDMDRGATRSPDVWLHEFGHHAFGLGDEYDEQHRFGGPCGIGPSFDTGTTDEQNHTIMQQTGSARCVGGAMDGASCLDNLDCTGGACQLVLMSELSVPGNHDLLQGDGFACPAVPTPCPDNAYCMRVFNSTTNRYERTQQSELHDGDSDWTTLVQNYPFVVAPAGLPQASAPAPCFRPVDYVDEVVGSDQVLLLLDRSGSMAWSSRVGVAEVCGNGADDDSDGSVDESDCADPRINFVKDAAQAYLDLQVNNAVDVGIMTFNQTPVLDQMITTLTPGNLATFQGIVAGLMPGGDTGIGDALDASNGEFTRVATLGRSRTAYLMTDGFNTSGVAPEDAAERLHDIGVRVHVIPAGSDVNELELGGVASATAGSLFPAPTPGDLTGIYAELAARHQGAALVLPRTNFELSLTGKLPQEGTTLPRGSVPPPRERTFVFPVEKNAKQLVAFVSGRNARMIDWAVDIELRGPAGEVFHAGSPELTVRDHYLFVQVWGPSAGDWKLAVRAAGAALQQGTAVAYVNNPAPDLFVDVKPRVLLGGGHTRISAQPLFVSRLDERDVALKGRVIAPDGSETPANFQRGPGGAWEADVGTFTLSGMYQVEVQADVGSGALPGLGESIYAGPDRAPVSVTPFHRVTTTSFAVRKGKGGYPCLGPPTDCDADGIPDREECTSMAADLDKDGRPNGRDEDADGDEIPDSVEGLRDRNQNKIPDMCEPGPKRK
jgi:hypothetical protein